ncbi:IPT/TIG domain-containing protein [Dyadobacter luticola]|uniref:IPT/TIG domain-containing protein n=1 Tax=Dyadobacter luticola TaxID=1979387 RepID=A0A5R9L0Y4_9BACT|nr:IPT/TIG domain-containing protein [Dyadobacter luticola]TLV02202.1 hypothetical protein FEN17_00750 [Dyadobacter luticola]
MKNRFQLRFSAVIGFCMLIMLLAACDNNDVTKTDEVQLLSFGPSGVKPGDDISFIGNNLDKVTSVELTGASVPASAFIKQSPELIVLKVPTETSEGKVTLKTAQGDIVSKTILSFEVAVKITKIPAQARPGDNITITGEYLNWVKAITFAKDTTVTKFVSQSVNELVVTVPFGAETGALIFSTGGTEPLTIESESPLNIALPAIKSFSPAVAEKEKNLTITGTNLDLTMGVLFKGVAAPVTQFVSKTATQLVVKIPKAASKGAITLVAFSGINIESTEILRFTDDLPDLAALKYAMYEDALLNSWQNWGWGATFDFANTERVRDGAASAKVVYAGTYGALKFANGTVATSAYSTFTFSIFGGAGSKDKVINVSANGGKAFPITVKEGVWTEYKLTKASLGNPATLTDLVFQDAGWAGTIYIDHVGLQ